jgi:hypothetical protein
MIRNTRSLETITSAYVTPTLVIIPDEHEAKL